MGIPPYVVRIAGQSRAGQDFNGTGFIVSPKGHVVTCRHVVVQNDQPAKSIRIYISSQRDPWGYLLVGSSKENDLALLEGVVPPSSVTPYAILHPDWHQDAEIGQQVAIYGHSSADNYPSGQMYKCSISGFSEKDERVGVVGDVNPGDSGGPVLDDQERVIGVIHARDRTRDGQARFIPASLLIELLVQKQVPFSGKSQATPASPKAGYIPNPFLWRNGITATEAFFNRESEQNRLRDSISGHQNCQVHGPRRIGKSSLLLQVERSIREWHDRAVIAYIDLQDARCNTLPGWLAQVSKKFSWTQTATSLAEFNEGIDEMISRKLQPVLCLDEFEVFKMRPDHFTWDFFFNLRSAGGRGLTMITASQSPLNKLTDPNDTILSPFYNIFNPVKLGPFKREVIDDFLSLLRPDIPPFDPEEKEAIRTFSRGYPLALQVACFHVVNGKKEGLPLSTAMNEAKEELKSYWHADSQLTFE
jgi:hypothetical protein